MSGQITIRFYEELNEFLPVEQRTKSFPYTLKQAVSVKDLIESLGVPHTEVDLILVNGHSENFEYCVRNGDHISVYPVFESWDISAVNRLRPAPLRDTRFVLDTQLGRLAAYLRMLGFDTLYRKDYDNPDLVKISVDENRILLTRDRLLLMHRQITHGYYVREKQPRRQLLEIISRFDLSTSLKPLTRCLRCNGLTQPVSKATITHQLSPQTRSHHDEFWQCQRCQKIYWKGRHLTSLLSYIHAWQLGLVTD
jgi:uncharacterized protein with PIN domain